MGPSDRLDQAAGSFDRCLGSLGYCYATDRKSASWFQFAGKKHPSAFNGAVDQASIAQRQQVDSIALDSIELGQPDLRGNPRDTAIETIFGQTFLQGHLPAFKTRTDGASGARLLTLVPTATGLAEATADAAANAPCGLDPARSRF